jgi:hypothetical protein
LAGAGGLFLFLLFFVILYWCICHLSVLFNNSTSSNKMIWSWSWSKPLALTGFLSLVVIQSWYLVFALIFALALYGVAEKIWKKLKENYKPKHILLILGLYSITGMFCGGSLGWFIREAYHL